MNSSRHRVQGKHVLGKLIKMLQMIMIISTGSCMIMIISTGSCRSSLKKKTTSRSNTGNKNNSYNNATWHLGPLLRVNLLCT